MEPPETRYAKSGDGHIAYQVIGTGPLDLVFVTGFVANLDLIWEEPAPTQFFSRLASFSRLILFDKRGTGLSDRLAGIATLEDRMDDVVGKRRKFKPSDLEAYVERQGRGCDGSEAWSHNAKARPTFTRTSRSRGSISTKP